jgi:hypothetical protein
MSDPVLSGATAARANSRFRNTVLTFALWGPLFAGLVYFLAILIAFFIGTLWDRPDLGIFGKIIGAFVGMIYAALVFSPVYGLWALFAAVPSAIAGALIAAWNRGSVRFGLIVPAAIGVVLGGLTYAVKRYFGLLFLSGGGYDLQLLALDIVAISFAAVMCWRRVRTKHPPVTP